MDSATAALMGAAIAGSATFLAGAVGPLVRDLIDSGRAERRERRAELRGELATYMTALKQHLDTLQGGSTNAVAESSMAVHLSAERAFLLLTTKEESVATLLFGALDAPTGDGVAIRIQATMNTIRSWYRGGIRPKDVPATFEDHVKKGAVELARLRAEGSILAAPLNDQK
jgi:hypothetical protein